MAFAITQPIIDALTAAHTKIFVDSVQITTAQTIAGGKRIEAYADTGWRFLSTGPKIAWKYSTVNQSAIFGSRNADSTYAAFTLQASASYVYNSLISYVEEIPAPVAGTYTVTADMVSKNTAAHCKLYKSGVLATTGTVFAPTDTFTLTADVGYKITSAGFQDTTSGDYLGFTISSDGSSATFINSTSAEIKDYAYGVSGEELPVGAYTFTQADLNATTTAQAKMYKGETLATAGMVFLQTDQFKLVANEGRLFTDGAVYFRDSNSGSTEPFEVATDRKTATYTNLYGAVLSGYTVATVAAPVAAHTISQGDLDAFTAAHAALTINGTPIALGDKIFPGDTIRATAGEGYVFTQNPNAPDGFISVQYQYLDSGGFNYLEREGDSFKAGFQVVPNYGAFGQFQVSTTLEQPEDVRGFNNVYEVNDDQLKLLATQRFVSMPDGGEQIDYGKYILGLIELPFTIDPAMVIDQQNISLGPLGTSINADYLNSDLIRLDLGTINVVGTKGNFLDYKDTVAKLHLPYCDSIALDLEMVIDQTISVEFLISLYDGTAIVNVRSSKTDDIITTQNIDMNISIPFGAVNEYPSKNNPSNIKLGGDNGIRTAFIELLRNDAVLESGFFTVPIVDEKPLTGYNGFVRVEEINLSSKATSYEKDLIVNKLNAGVIIK